jgi:hypothetical protein
MVTSTYVLARIDAMERELNEFRRRVLDPEAVIRARASLYGILGDVEFSDAEIEDAKRSLLRDPDRLGLDK